MSCERRECYEIQEAQQNLSVSAFACDVDDQLGKLHAYVSMDHVDDRPWGVGWVPGACVDVSLCV
jgi:hypothetical protein